MSELKYNQIVDKLNTEFASEGRRLVFWYDDNGYFAEDVDAMPLQNAKIWHLTPTNQFRTKILLEREDPQSNYLIYAPFPKPPVEQNHLEDTILYSKQFHADPISLLCSDLGIGREGKRVLQQYAKVVGEQTRKQRFCDYKLSAYTTDATETALLCTVCKCRTAQFEDALREILLADTPDANPKLDELAKYKLDEVFWKHCETELGFAVPAPNVDKLKISLFVTSLAHSVKVIPDAWQPFAAAKPGSVLAFMDGMMNNVNYGDAFDAMAAAVQETLHVKAALAKLPHDLLTDCECLPCVDDLLTGWMTERLQAEDVTAALNGENIPELCQRRAKTHFGRKLAVQYAMLESAWHIVSAAHYRAPADYEHVWAQYYREDYKIDAQYRAFYTAYDKLDEPAAYDKLQGLVENIYNTEYLAKIIPAWNTDFPQEPGMGRMALQRNFFSECVAGNKERTVVIISDAMRYEVGAELAALLAEDPKSTVQLTPRLGVLPSYTRLGMAALLPHTRMEMTPEYQVLIDDMPCENLAQRQAVLQKRVPQSGCIQFDDLKSMKKDDLRAVFTGKQVVYIYHNQIDARGDKPNTEDEVFAACREAVEEIAAMIRRIAGSANTLHFIVTADHGFLYKRHALAESDKIPNTAPKTAFVNRRFIVDADPIAQPGVASLPMATVLNTKTNTLTVSYPTAANVFKVAGGGENYVHGGSSPQEMIVPVLDVRMEKGRMETTTVQLTLVSILKKITNLITALDFMQNEPISDTVRETTFRVYFVGEDNERISNENIVVADKRGETAAERMFRLRFSFKNQKYDNKKPYYLVAYDDKNSVEVLRRQVVMDIAMADDFGFGF